MLAGRGSGRSSTAKPSTVGTAIPGFGGSRTERSPDRRPAKLEIPPDGVPSNTPTYEELRLNQDELEPAEFDREKVRKMIQQWK